MDALGIGRIRARFIKVWSWMLRESMHFKMSKSWQEPGCFRHGMRCSRDVWEWDGCMPLVRDDVERERKQDVGPSVMGTGCARAWTQPGFGHGNGMQLSLDVVRMWAWM